MRHLGFDVPSGVPDEILEECEIEMHPPAMIDFDKFVQAAMAVHTAAAAELADANTSLSSTSADAVRQSMATEFASTATTAMAGTDRSHIVHGSGAVKERPGRVTYKSSAGASCGMLSPHALPSASVAERDAETYDV